MQRYNLFRKNKYLCTAKEKHGALAHLARAFDWQSRGGEFESRMLHKKDKGCYDVASLYLICKIKIYTDSTLRYQENYLPLSLILDFSFWHLAFSSNHRTNDKSQFITHNSQPYVRKD